jgi:hypothetical protein
LSFGDPVSPSTSFRIVSKSLAMAASFSQLQFDMAANLVACVN